MENNLMIFDERKVLGKDFKIYGTKDNPLFLAKDVAVWIGHSNVSKMVSTIDEEEKEIHKLSTLTNGYTAIFLTEDGLYEVLMQSRKPIAKQFKKEVKKILKQIRKNGMYATDELLDNPDLLIAAATKLKEEREKNRILNEINEKQTKIIGELQPRADYTDKILKNTGLVTISQIAKDYGMSGQALNKMLHELKVQYKQSQQWLLYRNYQDKGYTFSDTKEITRSDGRLDIKMTTKWTQKGRLFIYELLKTQGVLPTIELS